MKRWIPLLAAALCACSSTPLRYAPFGPPKQFLPPGLPLLTLDKVVDETDHNELYVHHVGGNITDVSDVSGASFDPGVAWPASVKEALELELKRIGWPTAESSAVKAAGKAAKGRDGDEVVSARLRATVVQARADMSAEAGAKVDGNIRIKLVLTDAKGREVWRGGLEGDGDGMTSATGSSENGIREAWTAALGSAIARLGPLLAAERPWEYLDKNRVGPGDDMGAVPTDAGQMWWKKGK